MLWSATVGKVAWYPMEEDCYREIGLAVNNFRNVSPAVKKMMEMIKAFVAEM